MKKISTLLFALMVCIGASAQVNLAEYISQKVAELSSKYEVVPVMLDTNKEYVLDSQVKLGLQKVAIWGNEATVVVTGDGQIATQNYLQVRSVKFDLENAKTTPIALEAEADQSLFIMDQYAGANQNWPHAKNKIGIMSCAFREVKNGIFGTNGANWAIDVLNIDGCVAQVADKVSNPVLNIKGSVKNLIITNNTFYKVNPQSDKVFVTFGNASNAQPQKVWGTDAVATWFVKNNTFYNTFGNKAFGDQMPSKNNITITAKQNIFYNVFRFQNKFVGNGVKNYVAGDNLQFCTLESPTIENGLGTDMDPKFVAPTEALDLNNVAALKENFTPKADVAYFNACGAKAWATTTYKSAIQKYDGKNYEVVLGPDMVDMTGGIKEGAVKPVMADGYAWIEYVNPTSSCDDGRAEVQTSNRWTDIDPITGVQGEFIQVKGANGSVNSPVISKQWGKVINLHVTNMAKVVVYATGSASGSAADGNGILLTAIANDGTIVTAETEPGSIYGKGTKSACCAIDLDPAKYWTIEINSLIGKDMMLTGLNLYTADQSYAKTYHVKGANYESEAVKTNYEVISTQDFLSATKKMKQDGSKEVTALRDDLTWAEYINETSPLLAGGYEVSAGNRMTSYDLFTAEATDNPQMLPATDGQWLGGYPTIENQKKLIIRLDNTSDWNPLNVRFVFTGAGSNANKAKVTIENEYMDDEFETEDMTGKSQKANNTKSCVVERMLFAPGKYTITVSAVEGASALCALHLTNDWEFEATPANAIGTGIENVETEVATDAAIYNVAGQRVNSNAKGLIITKGAKFINK